MPESELLLVVGPPRSGTTLLRDLLICHPAVCMPNHELQVLHRLAGRARRLNSEGLRSILKNSPVVMLNDGYEQRLPGISWDPNEPGRSIRDVLAALTDCVGEDTRFVGEKTPLNALFLLDIERAFGPAKVIFIFRDPRDVSLSQRRAWGKTNLATAVQWLRVYRSFKERVESDPTSVTAVRYEDLVMDPEAVLFKIGHFLDLSGLPEQAKRFVSTNDRYSGSEEGPTRGITTRGVFRHERDMGPVSAGGVSFVAKEGMEFLGYEKTNAGPGALAAFFVRESFVYAWSLLRAFVMATRQRGLFGLRYRLIGVLNRYS